MLNAREAEAAYKALTYPAVGSRRDRAARDILLAEYDEATNKITGEFREWLANEYAHTLPDAVSDKIWEKAWSDGHHAGYPEVENYYSGYAEFAQFVMDKAPRPTAG